MLMASVCYFVREQGPENANSHTGVGERCLLRSPPHIPEAYVFKCIYIYIYIYTHICMYIFVYIYIYICIYIYIYIHVYVYIYIYIYPEVHLVPLHGTGPIF